jgi:hypothetical protein
MHSKIGVFCLILISLRCSAPSESVRSIPEDTLVSIMIDLYSLKAAINMNHPSLQDSTSKVYYEQMQSIYGYTPDEIKHNLELLSTDIDSMMILQNRALDSLRLYNEKRYQSQYSSGIINN